MDYTFFKKGLKDGLPIGVSYIPASMALSVSAQKIGIPFGSWILMNVLDYTGCGEVALLKLWSGGETILFMYLLIFFMIISRHFLYSLSLSQKLDKDVNIFHRLLFAHLDSDEVFAVSMQQPGTLKYSYLFGIVIAPFVGWITGIITGFLFTQLLPASVSSAFGITLYSVFLTLIIPPMKSFKPVFIVVTLAALLSLFVEYVPAIKASLSSGLSMILCTLITCIIGAIFFPVDSKDEEEISEDLNKNNI